MRCEIHATAACEGRGYHCHHKLMRSAGGQHTVENLVLVCETCHRYTHAHPRLAYEEGWLIRRS
jgi:5-methylcytosine-specific restriction endonuclease McrA